MSKAVQEAHKNRITEISPALDKLKLDKSEQSESMRAAQNLALNLKAEKQIAKEGYKKHSEALEITSQKLKSEQAKLQTAVSNKTIYSGVLPGWQDYVISSQKNFETVLNNREVHRKNLQIDIQNMKVK